MGKQKEHTAEKIFTLFFLLFDVVDYDYDDDDDDDVSCSI